MRETEPVARPLCKCHGQPAYWTVDQRYTADGYWRCAVKKRRYQLDRYDADPIHRLSKNLLTARRKRGVTLARRKQLTEGS